MPRNTLKTLGAGMLLLSCACNRDDGDEAFAVQATWLSGMLPPNSQVATVATNHDRIFWSGQHHTDEEVVTVVGELSSSGEQVWSVDIGSGIPRELHVGEESVAIIKTWPGPAKGAIVSCSLDGRINWEKQFDGIRFGSLCVVSTHGIVAAGARGKSGGAVVFGKSRVLGRTGGALTVVLTAEGEEIQPRFEETQASDRTITRAEVAWVLALGDSRYLRALIRGQDTVLQIVEWPQRVSSRSTWENRSLIAMAPKPDGKLVGLAPLEDRSKYAVAEFSANGHLMQETIIDASPTVSLHQIMVTPNGGYLVAGSRQVLGREISGRGFEPVLMRTNSDGTVSWAVWAKPKLFDVLDSCVLPGGQILLGGEASGRGSVGIVELELGGVAGTG